MEEFKSLGIEGDLLKGISDLGFTKPTPVQEQSIPKLLANSGDFMGLAQTGTGKTAAFGLPLLQLIDLQQKQVQGLILCPTRELCLQITKDLENFSKHLPHPRITAVYGGASISTQISQIRAGANIIVATPGRLIDLIGRKAVKLDTVKYVILDEADEMLNMGFKEAIDDILEQTPQNKRVWLFSATMPKEVKRIANTYMNVSDQVVVGTENSGNENIEHTYFITMARDKYAALKRLVDFYPEIFGLVFARTKREAGEIAEHLIKDGYNADALHGDLSQAQRDQVMGRFRNKTLQILVATDVAARGIDVNNVTHVINYGLPDDLEVYNHRTGRTGRAGNKGLALSIIHTKEIGRVKILERTLKRQFTKGEIPSAEAVCEKQLFSIIHKLHNIVPNEDINPYMPSIMAELEELSKEELIKRVASFEFNRFLEYYKNAKDLNYVGGAERKSRDTEPMTDLFISIGSMDGYDKGMLLKFINQSGLGNTTIGRIRIKDSYSFFEVSMDDVDEVVRTLNGMDHKGRPIRIEAAGAKKNDGSKRRRQEKRRGDGGGGNYGGGDRRGGGNRGGNYGGGDRNRSEGSGGGRKKSRY